MVVFLGDRLERLGRPWDVDPPMVCPDHFFGLVHELVRERLLATVHGLDHEPALDLAAFLVDSLRPAHRVFDRFAMTVDGSSFHGERTMRPFSHRVWRRSMPHPGIFWNQCP